MLPLLVLAMADWNRPRDVNAHCDRSGSDWRPPLPRPDSSTDELPSYSIAVLSIRGILVAIGFELAPCLDLVFVLCLSYDLDTDSIKLRIKVEFALLL